MAYPKESLFRFRRYDQILSCLAVANQNGLQYLIHFPPWLMVNLYGLKVTALRQMGSALLYKVGAVPISDVSNWYEMFQTKMEEGVFGFWLKLLGFSLSPLGENVKWVMIYQ